MRSLAVCPRPTPFRRPLVWLLMGKRVGDNNQMLALAHALDWPFETKKIRFNQLRRVPVLRSGLAGVARSARSLIAPPWPDLVLCVGYATVPVARHIRERSGGRARLVHIGNARTHLADFHLQITTPQYSREPAPNLLELPFPIGNPARCARPTMEELAWLRRFPRPRRLIAVGGPARNWALDESALKDAVRIIRGKPLSGSIIAAASHRTPDETKRMLERLLDGPHESLVERFPRFSTLLSECDELYVTADSVSMLTEAILTGKPVGMIPIQRSPRGKLSLNLWEKARGRAAYPDFEAFWAMLRCKRLIGTVDLPVAAQVCDTVHPAAEMVRSLMGWGDGIEQGRIAPSDLHLGAAWGPRGRQRSGDRARGSDRPSVRNKATGI